MRLRLGAPLPDLSGATEWLNGAARREDLRGEVVLVHFWAISCPICHDNMKLVSRWRDEYAPRGFKVIAVHMPRQETDLDVARVRQDVAALQLTEPCAIDNTHAVADAFENQFVPAYFLFDREGALRGRTAGAVGLQTLESSVKRQFKEQGNG